MNINKVVVIGSGTMGSGIAAHLCNANIPVVLLDLKTDIAEKAKENILKATKILDLYLEKIMNLNIGSIMMKDMSQQAASELFYSLDKQTSNSLDKLLEKCISTLRIG